MFELMTKPVVLRSSPLQKLDSSPSNLPTVKAQRVREAKTNMEKEDADVVDKAKTHDTNNQETAKDIDINITEVARITFGNRVH